MVLNGAPREFLQAFGESEPTSAPRRLCTWSSYTMRILMRRHAKFLDTQKAYFSRPDIHLDRSTEQGAYSRRRGSSFLN